MTLGTYPRNPTRAFRDGESGQPQEAIDPPQKKIHSSCHGCGVCVDRDDTQGNIVNGGLSAAYDTPAAYFLLFFVPAAAALGGAWACAHSAVTQWLGGIGGLVAGILAAVFIARFMWNTDKARGKRLD